MPTSKKASGVRPKPVYLRPVRWRVHLDEKIVAWRAVDEQGRVLATAQSPVKLKEQFPPETRFIDVEGILTP